MQYGKVIRVEKDSIAFELGITAGDKIISINDDSATDIIDFSFACAEEDIDLLVEHKDGTREMFSFSKDYDDELGIEFESAVFDGIRRCANHCVFCFVDQVPAKMRDSLYIKDDDYRLSFLYGNFITMTNILPKDIERIKTFHLSPLFISVHTTNMELREKILGTKLASNLLRQLKLLDNSGIEYHAQVVLCPELNDGIELDRTISDMIDHVPNLKSLAVVPVGLTKYREGCYPLKQFDRVSAKEVICQVKKWQEKIHKKFNKNYIYLADEFYFLAEEPIPDTEAYDDFPQLDNGIGLARNFADDWMLYLNNCNKAVYDAPTHIDVICGTSIAPFFNTLLKQLNIKNLSVNIIPVKNIFFGESVNVSGLLTGQDIRDALLKSERKSDGVIIPRCAIRDGDNVFLDDMTIDELSSSIRMPIRTALSGSDLCHALAHFYENDEKEESGALYAWQSNAAYAKYSKNQDRKVST